MKKILTTLLTAAAALGFSSCEQSETPTAESKGIPMTLTASLPDNNARAGVTVESTGLKTSWDENDKISVIRLTSAGGVLSNDIFTSTNEAGANTATFTGTLSTTGSASNIVCWYPALTQTDSDGTSYSSCNGYDELLYGLRPNSTGTNYNLYYMYCMNQTANNSTDAVAKSLILSGTISQEGSTLNATLVPRSVILKLDIDVTNCTDLNELNYIRVTNYDSSDATRKIFCDNKTWRVIYSSGMITTAQTSEANKWGDDNFAFSMDFDKPGDNKITLYIPISITRGVSATDKWVFELNGYKSDNSSVTYKATKTFTKAVTFEAGKCYPITIAADEFSKVE